MHARGLLCSTALLAALFFAITHSSLAETCTTQSAMAAVDREGIAVAARSVAAIVQTNNVEALRSTVVAEVAKDFAPLQYLVGSTSAKVSGGLVAVDQVYLLDGSMLTRGADGRAPDAQFFCSLNNSVTEVDFAIPALPPGRYAFAIANVTPAGGGSHIPWRLSLLMRQEQGRWLLAGIYPRATTAAGHNGLWYWTSARQMAKEKQQWNAWLSYNAAADLLRPADFITTTHLEKLRAEAAAAAPPALSEGVTVDAPLVVKAANGTEYHFTALGVDDTLGAAALDIAAHLRVDSPLEPAAARARNNAAAAALVAAYPEMRGPFHGVWIYADAPGQSAFATEEPMSEIK
jgi:hypothetical protein